MVSDPMVMAGGVGVNTDVRAAYTSAVSAPDVCSASTVPAPSVTGEPTARVEPEMRYCECGFGVTVSAPMVRRAEEGRGEVRGP